MTADPAIGILGIDVITANVQRAMFAHTQGCNITHARVHEQGASLAQRLRTVERAGRPDGSGASEMVKIARQCECESVRDEERESTVCPLGGPQLTNRECMKANEG